MDAAAAMKLIELVERYGDFRAEIFLLPSGCRRKGLLRDLMADFVVIGEYADRDLGGEGWIVDVDQQKAIVSFDVDSHHPTTLRSDDDEEHSELK